MSDLGDSTACCLLQCKVGRVVGNLKALEHMLPEEVDLSTVVQYMPSLLLSDMKKVFICGCNTLFTVGTQLRCREILLTNVSHVFLVPIYGMMTLLCHGSTLF